MRQWRVSPKCRISVGRVVCKKHPQCHLMECVATHQSVGQENRHRPHQRDSWIDRPSPLRAPQCRASGGGARERRGAPAERKQSRKVCRRHPIGAPAAIEGAEKADSGRAPAPFRDPRRCPQESAGWSRHGGRRAIVGSMPARPGRTSPPIRSPRVRAGILAHRRPTRTSVVVGEVHDPVGRAKEIQDRLPARTPFKAAANQG